MRERTSMPAPQKKGPKFTPTDRERVIAEVARLDRRGYSQWDIADHVGVCQSTVGQYLATIRQRYKEEARDELTSMREEKRRALEDLRAEAWLAYERSKEDKERIVKEKGKTLKPVQVPGQSPGEKRTLKASFELLKEVTTREGRLPESEYLRIVLETHKAEIALYGLNEPEQLKITAGLDWNALLRGLADPVPDPLEAEVQRLSDEVARARAEGRQITVGETGDAEDDCLIEEGPGPEEGEGAEGGDGPPAGAF
jgi:predicted transcriptional regulator